MIGAANHTAGVYLANPAGKGPGFEFKTHYSTAEKFMLYGLRVHLFEDGGVLLREGGLREEGFACADGEGNDQARLGKVAMDAIGDAGPLFIEAIVEDDDSALGQCAFRGGQIMGGDFSRVPAVDADQTEGTAAKLKQMRGGQLGRVSLMNDEAARV